MYSADLGHGADLVTVEGEPLQLGEAWAGPAIVRPQYLYQTQNKVVIKQCFFEFEINSREGNTVCVGDNCIIYGIEALRDLEMVKPL